MSNEERNSGAGASAVIVLLAVVGFFLIFFIENRTIATELVITIAFAANAIAIAVPALQPRRRRVTHLTGALLFGALSAILFS